VDVRGWGYVKREERHLCGEGPVASKNLSACIKVIGACRVEVSEEEKSNNCEKRGEG